MTSDSLLVAAGRTCDNAGLQLGVLHEALRRGSRDALTALARNPHLCGAAREQVLGLTDEQSRAAFLRRDDLGAAELRAIAERERRGELLALIVGSPQCPPALLDELTRLNKRPVAAAILGLKVAPADAVRAAVRTIDGFAERFCGACLPALTACTVVHDDLARRSSDLFLLRSGRLAASEVLSYDAELRLVELLVERPAARVGKGGDVPAVVQAIRDLATRRSLSLQARTRLEAATDLLSRAYGRAAAAPARAALGLVRPIGALGQLEGEELVDEIAFCRAHGELARIVALYANPALTGAQRVELASHCYGDELGRAYPDDPWLRIVLLARRDTERWRFASDPETLARTTAAALAGDREIQEHFRQGARLGLLEDVERFPSILDSLPVRDVACSTKLAPLLAERVFVAGGDAGLELFWALLDDFEGSAGELVETCAQLTRRS